MRLTCFAAIAILAAGCASPTEPHTGDVAYAYVRWSAFHPPNYSFDLSIAGSMMPSTGPYHITVTDGRMISALDPSGAPTQFSAITIDTLWAKILSARQVGALNSAEFSLSGVPTDVDMGDWASDGGVGYRVRHFVIMQTH